MDRLPEGIVRADDHAAVLRLAAPSLPLQVAIADAMEAGADAIDQAHALRAELDETRRRLDQADRNWQQAREENERLQAHILDIDAHATPYADIPDEPGYVGTYLVTAGALHRALGKISHTAPSCKAEADLTEHRKAMAALHHETDGITMHRPSWQAARDRVAALLEGRTGPGQVGS